MSSWLKRRSSDTPATISGVTSGNSIRRFEAPEPRPRQRARPSASKTPIGVAISTSSPASFMLCSRAPCSSALWNTESMFGFVLVYHFSVKPCQMLNERLSLNENWMATSTGTIDQTT